MVWRGNGYYTDKFKIIRVEKIAKFFHSSLEKICEENKKGSYKKYKKWCDDYFYLPHRNEPRGLGGIFYDYLNSENWQEDFNFTRKVGETFINSYTKIVNNTKKKNGMKKINDSSFIEDLGILSLTYFMTGVQIWITNQWKH